MSAVGCCLAGPGHEVAGCRTLEGSRAKAGSLIGGVTAPKSLSLLPTHWQLKPGSGVRAELLVGRACFWSLAAGSRDPQGRFRS